MKSNENNLYLIDCMEFMKDKPDNFYDLAIVDPPYGIGNFTQSDRKKKYGDYKWNESPPDKLYFDEMIRVSKNQIIWGANYYNCFDKKGGAIIWNKKNPHPNMSKCEIASVSSQKKVDYFEHQYYGFVGCTGNIHPCQKPVALYKWLLKNYAKEGFNLLDTHSGSGSFRIACYDMGFDLDSCELDKDYFEANEKRYQEHVRLDEMQGKLFI